MALHLSLTLAVLSLAQDGLEPTEHVTDIAVSEEFAGLVQKDLKRSLVQGLRTRNWQRVEDAFDAGLVAGLPAADALRTGTTAGAVVLDWPGAARADLDRAAVVGLLRAGVEDWVSVDRAKLKLYRFLLGTSRQEAYGAAHLLLAGRLPDGRRTELHGDVELGLVQDGLEPWRIRAARFLDGHQVTGSAPAFQDVSDALGFRFNQSGSHAAFNQALIDDRHLLTVGGVNAIDWNRDGFWDLLVTLEDQMTVLFQNDGRGGFNRVPLPLQLPRDAAKTFLYLDLDGDGLEELVCGKAFGDGPDHAGFELFTRSGPGTWRRVADALRFSIPTGVTRFDVQGIEAGDVDGDGLLDLFFAVRSDSRSGGEAFNRFVAYDGGDNLLFLNRGELAFEEVSNDRGIEGTQYTFIGRILDFDADGDPDLFEGNDFGPNRLYRNDGTGHFVLDRTHPLSDVGSYTMGFTLADIDNTGDRDIHLSNMYSHAGNRIVPLASVLEPEIRDQVAVIGEGNQVYRHSASTGRWSELGRDLRVHDSGWAWGSIFFDLDNDGDKELFVTNGYTSNSDREAPDW